MNKLEEKLLKLLEVESIIAFILVIAFVALSFKGSITGREYVSVFIIVILYYFGMNENGKRGCHKI